ncbi:MAG: hypothetical protein LBN27_05185 [Prevotellaceae bacterium]|jgi:hypothetical protein|nr:hypothetical protein [Prevotellaceae bacterium]
MSKETELLEIRRRLTNLEAAVEGIKGREEYNYIYPLTPFYLSIKYWKNKIIKAFWNR